MFLAGRRPHKSRNALGRLRYWGLHFGSRRPRESGQALCGLRFWASCFQAGVHEKVGRCYVFLRRWAFHFFGRKLAESRMALYGLRCWVLYFAGRRPRDIGGFMWPRVRGFAFTRTGGGEGSACCRQGAGENVSCFHVRRNKRTHWGAGVGRYF